MEDLACADGERGGEDFGEKREKVFKGIGSCPDDDETDLELRQHVLKFKSPIYGQENIEVSRPKNQKLSVLSAAPARFRDCLDRVAWKGGSVTIGYASSKRIRRRTLAGHLSPTP